jgi:cytochrome c5
MKKISIKTISYMLMVIASNAHAASGEEVYKSACSTCHDSGAGQAPRVTHRDEWVSRWQRGRDAMHEAGIKGVPNTAMAAKGGFSKLSDAEVKAAVDYILARTGFQESLVVRSAVPGPSVAAQPGASGAAVDDNTLQKQVAEALRNGMASGAQIESVEGKLLVRGVNIRVSARDGAVTLEGMLEKPDIISRAEKITGSVNGVRRVDNKLVAAGLFDWD